MHIEKLNEQNVSAYLDYLRAALADEPDMLWIDRVDALGIRDRVRSGGQSTSLLAMEGRAVLGRLEYHFYSCIQDGYKMAYVDWVYVSRPHRHRGIAQALFRAFEEECRQKDIDEYFLLQARNKNAERFYSSFQNASSAEERILRKKLK